MISPINEIKSFNDKLYPTSKRSPCDVCGDVSGKCRSKNNEESFTLCANTPTARKGDKEGAYKCIDDHVKGHAPHAWVISKDDYESWSDEQKTKFKLDQQLKKAEAEKERQAKIASEVSIDERDRINRLILEQLKLTDADKQHLLNRGFTSQQIEDCNFRSVNQGQRFKLPGCPANFPGLVNSGFGDTSNRKMIVSGKGILCPILQDGKIVAFKIRFTEAKDGQRYSSVSCTSASFHVMGEQPIAVLHPPQPGYKPGIWITEGSEIKPVFLSQRYNVAVLGGGRYWHNSPNHAAKFLPLFRELYGNDIILCLDAGDILNRQVFAGWLAEAEFFVAEGFNVKFGWWGQITKNECDIDELDNLDSVKLITLDELKTLENETACYKEWLESIEYTADPEHSYSEKWFKFSDNLPSSGAIIAGKTYMGGGKSLQMLFKIKSNDRKDIYSIVITPRKKINAQLAERGKNEDFDGKKINLNIYLLSEDDGISMDADNYKNWLLCPESLHKLRDRFRGKDVWIDEVETVFKQILSGGTLQDKLPLTLEVLKEALSECNNVYLLDANLSDKTVALISQLAPDKKVIKIENTYQPERLNPVVFIDCVENENVKLHDKSAFTDLILNENKPIIGTDSQTYANQIEKLFFSQDKHGFILDSHSNEENWTNLMERKSELKGWLEPKLHDLKIALSEVWTARVLKNPDKFLQEFKPDYLIYTTTAESGYSITLQEFFTGRFLAYFGVIGTDGQIQMSGRLRDDLPTYVYCPEKSVIPKNNDFNLKRSDWLANLMKNHYLAFQSTLDTLPSQVLNFAFEKSRTQDIWWNHDTKLQALENFEKANLRDCLTHKFKLMGYQVEIKQLESNPETKASLKQAKNAIQSKEAIDKFNAVPYETIEDAIQAKNKSDSLKIRYRVEKTKILHSLPGIEDSDIWSVDYILECFVKNRNWFYSTSNFYLLMNPEIAYKYADYNRYFAFTQEHINIKRLLKDRGLMFTALRILRIDKLIDRLINEPDLKLTNDSPEVSEIIEIAKTDKRLRKLAGYKPHKYMDNMGFINSMLGKVGVSLKKKQRTVNKVKTTFYVLNSKDFNAEYRLVTLQLIDKYFKNWTSEKYNQNKPDWQYSAKNNGERSPNVNDELDTEYKPKNQENRVVPFVRAVKGVDAMPEHITQPEIDEKINDGLLFIREFIDCHTLEGLTAFFNFEGMTQADRQHIKKCVWEQLTTEEKLTLKSLSSDNVAA